MDSGRQPAVCVIYGSQVIRVNRPGTDIRSAFAKHGFRAHISENPSLSFSLATSPCVTFVACTSRSFLISPWHAARNVPAKHGQSASDPMETAPSARRDCMAVTGCVDDVRCALGDSTPGLRSLRPARQQSSGPLRRPKTFMPKARSCALMNPETRLRVSAYAPGRAQRDGGGRSGLVRTDRQRVLD